jgi:lysophospholipase L1-like esterase
VLLIGDSITAGQVSQPLGPPFWQLLADDLGSGYEVTNVACGGTTARDWSVTWGNGLCGGQGYIGSRLLLDRAVPELPARVVTVMLGTNDSVGFFEPDNTPTQPDDYAAALEEIVATLLAEGALRVMLMTPPPMFHNADALDRLAAYREEVLALCGDEPRLVCGPDVFTLLQAADFQAGNVHPNRYGHEKISNALYEAITTLPLPEPGTGALFALGLVVIAVGRREHRVRGGPSLRCPGSRAPSPRG